jgi:hypothetical protein
MLRFLNFRSRLGRAVGFERRNRTLFLKEG